MVCSYEGNKDRFSTVPCRHETPNSLLSMSGTVLVSRNDILLIFRTKLETQNETLCNQQEYKPH